MDSDENRPLIFNNVRTVQRNDSNDEHYRDYKQRWFVLLVLSLANLSNAIVWISYAPVADFTIRYYDLTQTDDVNWLALVFPLATVPVSFLASWVLDTFGLRAGILLPVWLNLVGAFLRVVSTFDAVDIQWKFSVCLIGQSIAACAQPFFMIAPPKLAGVWFKAPQRATANTISSMSNLLGILITNIFAPFVVKSPADITLLNVITVVPCALACILGTFGICHSTPPTPPSSSAEEESVPYNTGIKQCIKNKQFIILTLVFGFGVSAFTCLSTLLQQILCPWGYTDKFVGMCGALLIASGVLGSFISGVYADYSKKFEEVCKTLFAFSSVVLVVFALIYHHLHHNILIAVFLSLFGFFFISCYPICMELGVECTYPVAEATSAGILVLSGQVQSIIYIILMQWISPGVSVDVLLQIRNIQDNNDDEICGGAMPKDYNVSTITLAGLACVISMLYTIVFKCPYKRLRTEEVIAAERAISERAYGATNRRSTIYVDQPQIN